ncbi:MAG: rod-binding protein [Sphingomonadales bacterium]|nr:rod-binding protein [Sphingomonadales bacterium]
MVDSIPVLAAPHNTPPAATKKEAAMRKAAVALEANFLSEMLKQAGFGKPRDAFGGGIGEEQFASFLCDEYGKSMANAGAIGLAESIFNAMQKGTGHAG